MPKRLLLSTLLLFAGCASTPKVVGKWKVQPSMITEGMKEAQIFADGTVLVNGTVEDVPFIMNWVLVEDQYVMVGPEESQVVVTFPDRDIMIWTEPERNEGVIVLHRISN